MQLCLITLSHGLSVGLRPNICSQRPAGHGVPPVLLRFSVEQARQEMGVMDGLREPGGTHQQHLSLRCLSC